MSPFLVFLHPLLLSISPNPSFIPSNLVTIFIGMLTNCDCSKSPPLWNCAPVHRTAQLKVCLFRHCSLCHIRRESCRHTVQSVAGLLHELAPNNVFSDLKIVLMLRRFPSFPSLKLPSHSGRWTRSKNPVILKVINHHHSPLEINMLLEWMCEARGSVVVKALCYK
jgi:hypothetical protein